MSRVLTISVSTGGHLLGVERFAVTDVRASGVQGVVGYVDRLTGTPTVHLLRPASLPLAPPDQLVLIGKVLRRAGLMGAVPGGGATPPG